MAASGSGDGTVRLWETATQQPTAILQGHTSWVLGLGLSADGNNPSVLAGLETARELRLLTIALAGGDGGQIAASKAVDHLLLTPSADTRVVKELQVTTYHVLWELVHVFFEQPGVLDPGVVS